MKALKILKKKIKERNDLVAKSPQVRPIYSTEILNELSIPIVQDQDFLYIGNFKNYWSIETTNTKANTETRTWVALALGEAKVGESTVYDELGLGTCEYFDNLLSPLILTVPVGRTRMLEYFRAHSKQVFTATHLNILKRPNTFPEAFRLQYTAQFDNIDDVFAKEKNQYSQEDFEWIYCSLGMVHKKGARKHYIQFLFIFLCALVYQEHISATQLNKRWRQAQKDFPELQDGLDDPSTRTITTCWWMIKKAIDKGLRLESSIDKLSTMLQKTQNPRLIAMIPFINHSKMTPQKLISDAFCEYSDFPWVYVFQNYGTLNIEKGLLDNYLDIIASDPLMGLKEQGISTSISNLSYLAYHLHLEIGGKTSLKQYRGIGSDENPTPIPMKSIIDLLIKKYKEIALEAEINWPENWRELSFKHGDLDRYIKFGGSKDDDDNDDDDNNPPPNVPETRDEPDLVTMEGDEDVEMVLEKEPTPGPSSETTTEHPGKKRPVPDDLDKTKGSEGKSSKRVTRSKKEKEKDKQQDPQDVGLPFKLYGRSASGQKFPFKVPDSEVHSYVTAAEMYRLSRENHEDIKLITDKLVREFGQQVATFILSNHIISVLPDEDDL